MKIEADLRRAVVNFTQLSLAIDSDQGSDMEADDTGQQTTEQTTTAGPLIAADATPERSVVLIPGHR